MTTNFKQQTPAGTTVDIDQIFIPESELIDLMGDLPPSVFKGSSLWKWGGSLWGQLGDGTSSTTKSSPIQVGSLTTWVYLTSCFSHSIAIKQDGTAWAWGYNAYGQLGTNDTTNYSSPIQVGTATNWVKAYSGEQGTILIDDVGIMWGAGGYAGLDGQPHIHTIVDTPGRVINAAIGAVTGAAINSDNELYTWGDGYAGGRGSGTTTDVSTPGQIGTLKNWKQVSLGTYNGLAVKTDGTLWAWGDGASGILGKGNLTDYSSPVQVGTLTNWDKVSISTAMGGAHVLAVKTDGSLWAWGYNGDGELGKGNLTSYSSPVQVGSLTSWQDVVATPTTSYALQTNGTLWAWGDCTSGPFNSNVKYSSPVQVGSLTSWAILTYNGALKLT
jgi:alpha-tubulin suppressor-like RCC1 family protein